MSTKLKIMLIYKFGRMYRLQHNFHTKKEGQNETLVTTKFLENDNLQKLQCELYCNNLTLILYTG